MKLSELQHIIAQLLTSADSTDNDPTVVTGKVWLPERLINATHNNDLLFLEFDSAPEEKEEARGFVEHEIMMLRQHIRQIIEQETALDVKTDAIVELFLMGHEASTTEAIKRLMHHD